MSIESSLQPVCGHECSTVRAVVRQGEGAGMQPGAHIQEVGVLYGDARQQVELVGALGRVPGHVVGLDLNLPRAEASRHQKERRGHGCYHKQQLQVQSDSAQCQPYMPELSSVCQFPSAQIVLVCEALGHQKECVAHGCCLSWPPHVTNSSRRSGKIALSAPSDMFIRL